MSKSDWLLGSQSSVKQKDFSDEIAFDDTKISFMASYCRGKSVLDLGCVQHNPENYKSRYWLHKAIAAVADQLEGLDLYEEGVESLRQLGYKVHVGDAQNFDLGKQYDVIVAGDLIEHLEDLGGFLRSCKAHLKQDGRILIASPNPWYWKYVVQAFFFAWVKNNPEHTLWMCPFTLSRLTGRYGMEIVDLKFGTQYFRDRFLPLPKGLRHRTFFAALKVAD